MNFFQENLKYLLFIKKQDLGYARSAYPQYLGLFARRVHIDWERFRGILLGVVTPDEDERRRIVEALGLDDQEVFAIDHADMRETTVDRMRRTFFNLNIATLFDSLEYGEKEKVASGLGVNASTITRWKSGKAMPGAKMLERIAGLFGLGSVSDLTEGFLFYRLEPATVRGKRARVSEGLAALDDRTFEAIYPALVRLVGA